MLVDPLTKWEKLAKKTVSASRPCISPLTGIITEIIELETESDEPRIFHTASRMADISRYHQVYGCERDNGGAGLTRTTATAAAIGECIERYCACFIANDPPLASYSELRDRGLSVVDPKSIALHSDTQYKKSNFMFVPFSADSKVKWVPGRSLITETDLFVPAPLVYLSYTPASEESHIVHAVSSGLACAMSRDEAILKGIYEVIERDAFIITWQNCLSRPRLTMAESSWLNQIIHKRFRSFGLEIELFDLTLDIPVNVVLALIVDRYGYGPAVAVGAAANLNHEIAALKALTEAAQTRFWVQHLVGRGYVARKPEDIRSFEDHVVAYFRKESLRYVDFLLLNRRSQNLVEQIKFESAREELDLCLKILRQNDLECVVVDLTTSDVQPLGFHVVKVIIPGLQDIHSDERYKLLGGQRLYQVPRKLGYLKNERGEDELNIAPHPFP